MNANLYNKEIVKLEKWLDRMKWINIDWLVLRDDIGDKGGEKYEKWSLEVINFLRNEWKYKK